ncbi:MAG: hypothetical protein EBU03_05780, partial [Methylophilaceae bacterium]|nr:hypothetical protein [Methylophilaceae bacterium]
MPAAAIVLPLAETIFGGAISSFVGSSLAAAGILAEGTLGAIEIGIIIGAGEGAVNAAVMGGDIAKAALMGGVSGGVAGGVSSEVGKALGGGAASPTASPDYPGTALGAPTVPTVAGLPELGSSAVKAAGQGAGSFAGALAGGAPLNTALQQGLRGAEIGGISGLVSGLAQYDMGVPKSDAATIGSTAGLLASYALPSVSGGSAKPSYTTPVQPSLSLQGPAPSPTLGQ